jgi:copper oxidase (laccase) domain-containing protein
MAVTDLWHKTLVSFGMADEPDDWADEYADETETRFFSYRRDGRGTGRQAGIVWAEAAA